MDIEDIVINTSAGSVVLCGTWVASWILLCIIRAAVLFCEGLPVTEVHSWIYTASTIVTCLVASYLTGKGLD